MQTLTHKLKHNTIQMLCKTNKHKKNNLTLLLNQILKIANAGYLIHQALEHADRLHLHIQGSEIRNSGKIYDMKSIYGQKSKLL